MGFESFRRGIPRNTKPLLWFAVSKLVLCQSSLFISCLPLWENHMPQIPEPAIFPYSDEIPSSLPTTSCLSAPALRLPRGHKQKMLTVHTRPPASEPPGSPSTPATAAPHWDAAIPHECLL